MSLYTPMCDLLGFLWNFAIHERKKNIQVMPVMSLIYLVMGIGLKIRTR